jgi:hypothetical protein
MKKFLSTYLICLIIFSSNMLAFAEADQVSFMLSATDSSLTAEIPNLNELLDKAEASAATPEGREILLSAREMIEKNVIVLGSCWDYIDEIYNRAQYADNKRLTTFRSKLEGPYVDDVLIQEGDWLYFMNHSYNNVEHSSIFVAWTDFASKEALMISYAGGNQSKPARYKIYDLSSVYNIMRPKP